MLINYYSVLGLTDPPEKITAEQIKKAYRALALLLHPDHHPDQTQQDKDRFLLLSTAYQVLLDTEKRREFDYELSKCPEQFIDNVSEDLILEEDLNESTASQTQVFSCAENLHREIVPYQRKTRKINFTRLIGDYNFPPEKLLGFCETNPNFTRALLNNPGMFTQISSSGQYIGLFIYLKQNNSVKKSEWPSVAKTMLTKLDHYMYGKAFSIAFIQRPKLCWGLIDENIIEKENIKKLSINDFILISLNNEEFLLELMPLFAEKLTVDGAVSLIEKCRKSEKVYLRHTNESNRKKYAGYCFIKENEEKIIENGNNEDLMKKYLEHVRNLGEDFYRMFTLSLLYVAVKADVDGNIIDKNNPNCRAALFSHYLDKMTEIFFSLLGDLKENPKINEYNDIALEATKYLDSQRSVEIFMRCIRFKYLSAENRLTIFNDVLQKLSSNTYAQEDNSNNKMEVNESFLKCLRNNKELCIMLLQTKHSMLLSFLEKDVVIQAAAEHQYTKKEISTFHKKCQHIFNARLIFSNHMGDDGKEISSDQFRECLQHTDMYDELLNLKINKNNKELTLILFRYAVKRLAEADLQENEETAWKWIRDNLLFMPKNELNENEIQSQIFKKKEKYRKHLFVENLISVKWRYFEIILKEYNNLNYLLTGKLLHEINLRASLRYNKWDFYSSILIKLSLSPAKSIKYRCLRDEVSGEMRSETIDESKYRQLLVMAKQEFIECDEMDVIVYLRIFDHPFVVERLQHYKTFTEIHDMENNRESVEALLVLVEKIGIDLPFLEELAKKFSGEKHNCFRIIIFKRVRSQFKLSPEEGDYIDKVIVESKLDDADLAESSQDQAEDYLEKYNTKSPGAVLVALSHKFGDPILKKIEALGLKEKLNATKCIQEKLVNKNGKSIFSNTDSDRSETLEELLRQLFLLLSEANDLSNFEKSNELEDLSLNFFLIKDQEVRKLGKFYDSKNVLFWMMQTTDCDISKTVLTHWSRTKKINCDIVANMVKDGDSPSLTQQIVVGAVPFELILSCPVKYIYSVFDALSNSLTEAEAATLIKSTPTEIRCYIVSNYQSQEQSIDSALQCKPADISEVVWICRLRSASKTKTTKLYVECTKWLKKHIEQSENKVLSLMDMASFDDSMLDEQFTSVTENEFSNISSAGANIGKLKLFTRLRRGGNLVVHNDNFAVKMLDAYLDASAEPSMPLLKDFLNCGINIEVLKKSVLPTLLNKKVIIQSDIPELLENVSVYVEIIEDVVAKSSIASDKILHRNVCRWFLSYTYGPPNSSMLNGFLRMITSVKLSFAFQENRKAALRFAVQMCKDIVANKDNLNIFIKSDEKFVVDVLLHAIHHEVITFDALIENMPTNKQMVWAMKLYCANDGSSSEIQAGNALFQEWVAKSLKALSSRREKIVFLMSLARKLYEKERSESKIDHFFKCYQLHMLSLSPFILNSKLDHIYEILGRALRKVNDKNVSSFIKLQNLILDDVFFQNLENCLFSVTDEEIKRLNQLPSSATNTTISARKTLLKNTMKSVSDNFTTEIEKYTDGDLYFDWFFKYYIADNFRASFKGVMSESCIQDPRFVKQFYAKKIVGILFALAASGGVLLFNHSYTNYFFRTKSYAVTRQIHLDVEQLNSHSKNSFMTLSMCSYFTGCAIASSVLALSVSLILSATLDFDVNTDCGGGLEKKQKLPIFFSAATILGTAFSVPAAIKYKIR